MSQHLRLLLNGATGRMGQKRHLEGALVELAAAEFDLEIFLVGRNPEKLGEISRKYGLSVSGTAEEALTQGSFDLFFECSNPLVRPNLLEQAMRAGIGVYTEKPLALSLDVARSLVELAKESKVFAAIVQDKLFTRGYIAAKRAIAENLLGEIYDIRCEFGYWVETGINGKPINRPSWNFQKEKGGSLLSDIYPHWNYMIETIDSISTVYALAKTHISHRVNESGETFSVTSEDVSHVIFETQHGITGSIFTSWLTRPQLPFTMKISGLKGSLVVTPDSCLLYRDNSTEELIDKFAIKPGDEFLEQWRLVLQSLADKKAVNFGFDSALRQVELCTALEQSVHENRKISIGDIRK